MVPLFSCSAYSAVNSLRFTRNHGKRKPALHFLPPKSPEYPMESHDRRTHIPPSLLSIPPSPKKSTKSIQKIIIPLHRPHVPESNYRASMGQDNSERWRATGQQLCRGVCQSATSPNCHCSLSKAAPSSQWGENACRRSKRMGRRSCWRNRDPIRSGKRSTRITPARIGENGSTSPCSHYAKTPAGPWKKLI